MKPENSNNNIGPEIIPSMPRPNIEYLDNISIPESGIETGAERFEQSAEARAVVSDVGVTTQSIISDLPLINNSINVVTNTTLSDMPLLANDEDLIEKEWVDKAKKIIADTKNDPYLREEEVGKLQVDYVKKRYGRSLGSDE